MGFSLKENTLQLSAGICVYLDPTAKSGSAAQMMMPALTLVGAWQNKLSRAGFLGAPPLVTLARFCQAFAQSLVPAGKGGFPMKRISRRRQGYRQAKQPQGRRVTAQA